MENSPRDYEKVKEILKRMIWPDMTGLDLGCGNGRYTAEFAALCRQVTGVDKKEKCRFGSKFDFRSALIGEWASSLTDESWDFIHLRLILHLFEKESAHHMMVETASRTKPGGFVYILTYNDHPTDNFPEDVLKSLHTVKDIIRYFPRWKTIWAEQYKERELGYQTGRLHTFFRTELLLVKPV